MGVCAAKKHFLIFEFVLPSEFCLRPQVAQTVRYYMAKLGKELFSKMQAIQGHSFLSDAIEEMSDDHILELAPIILEWQEEGVKVLREFLETHLAKRPPDQKRAGLKSKRLSAPAVSGR